MFTHSNIEIKSPSAIIHGIAATTLNFDTISKRKNDIISLNKKMLVILQLV